MDGDEDGNDDAWYIKTLHWALVNFCARDATIMSTALGMSAENYADVPAWEYLAAAAQVLTLELAYVYFVANFTAIMLRYFQRLESYRTNMNAVDSYLQRNHVSRKLRAFVRKHFKQVFRKRKENRVALRRAGSGQAR